MRHRSSKVSGAVEASLLGDGTEIPEMAEFHDGLPQAARLDTSAAISADAASSASSAAT